MNKRRVLIAAIAVCLVAILACGSLAYFTYTSDTVTNKFYTYSTDEYPDGPPTDPDQLFSISVYETYKNADNETVKDYDGLEYTEVVPGTVLSKDPTVENTGKYSAYVRLRVTLTNAEAWQKACTDIGLTKLEDIFGGINTDWERKSESYDADADTMTYVYYLNKPLAAGETSTLFTTVTMPAKLTVEHMIALSQFQLIIEGDAIQSENTGDNAYATFTDTEYWNK